LTHFNNFSSDEISSAKVTQPSRDTVSAEKSVTSLLLENHLAVMPFFRNAFGYTALGVVKSTFKLLEKLFLGSFFILLS
jgi:hypothetical protein